MEARGRERENEAGKEEKQIQGYISELSATGLKHNWLWDIPSLSSASWTAASQDNWSDRRETNVFNPTTIRGVWPGLVHLRPWGNGASGVEGGWALMGETGRCHCNSLWSLVQFSCSVVSDSLQPNELQHTRPPCPPTTPRVYPNTCPSSCWCHPAISSSVVPFSFCPQSFPASGSFPMSQLFAWGGESIGVSALTSVLPMNIQDWSPLGWTGWISLQSKGLSRIFSNTTVQKHQFFGAQLSLGPTHIHTWPLEKA